MPKAKRGRPRLPKGEGKGKIVPVRFDVDDFSLVTAAAKADQVALSEWIRKTLRATAEQTMCSGTLHDAMVAVLSREPGFTADTSYISEKIAQQKSYRRKDGAFPRAQQINARARKYPHIFAFVSKGVIRLISENYAGAPKGKIK